jgi:hypothetical protein
MVCTASAGRRSSRRLLGLIISAVLLSNWQLRFAVDAPDFYAELYDEAVAEAETETLGWLVSAAYGYHNLRRANAKRVRIMGHLLTVLWGRHGPTDPLLACGPPVGSASMAPRPVPPDQIKTPSIKIGIQEGRGGSTPPAPRPNGQ